VGRPLECPRVDPYRLVILSGLVSPRGWLLRIWPVEAHGREGSCVLVHEPSWHDDITVIVSLFLVVVAALDEELARPVVAEVGSEGNTVWSARCGALCAQGGLLPWMHVPPCEHC
jgi:hypothetical protein